MIVNILSINIASQETISFNNNDIHTGIFKRPIEGEIQVNKLGLSGDTVVDKKVHGGIDQAIYLYHQEDYDWWSEQLGRQLEPGTFGENLTIAGASDVSWVIGDRLIINGVELEISAPRTPCFKLGVKMGDNTFVKRFAEACRPGAYARVITEGIIRQGDTITVKRTDKDYAVVNDIFKAWHSKNKPLPVLKKALDSPIASVHRGVIQAWYDEQA